MTAVTPARSDLGAAPPLRSLQWAWLSAALALALQTPQQPLWYSVLLVLLGLPFAWRARTRIPAPPRRGWRVLGLAALALAIVLAYHGQLLTRETGIAAGTGLLLLKLMESRQRRDLQVVAGFACFIVMTALLADQSLLLTMLAGLGLLPPLCCLQALQADPQQPTSMWREIAVAAGRLLLALPLTAAVFLLVPRLGAPLWAAASSQQSQTGLSDHLSTADFSQLIRNDAPAMRVNFEGSPPSPNQLYFRAYVMWRFDGQQWSAEQAPIQPPANLPAIAPADGARYQVTLLPNDQHRLPVLDWPASLPALAGDTVMLDRAMIVHRNQPVDAVIRYSLSARFSPPAQSTELDLISRNAALQWPAGAAPKTLALGRQWQQAGLDAEAIAAQAMAMFRQQGFSYTLEPPALPADVDSTDGFLFTTRRGYCAHYASAFVLLMRAAGVPARVVSGYQGGYWNPAAQYLLVRQSDAHAWAEVWLADRHAWVRYDPTSMASPERISDGALAADSSERAWIHRGWLESLQNHWDLVNHLWDQSVIGFDQVQQLRLWSDGVAESWWRLYRKQLAMLAALIMLAAAGLYWAQRPTTEPDPVRRSWQLLLDKLARQGLPIGVGEGPQAYLDRAADAFPAQRKEIERLRTLYILLRYAPSRASADQIRIFRHSARNFWPKKLSDHS